MHSRVEHFAAAHDAARARRSWRRAGRLGRGEFWLIGALIAVPALLMAAKTSGLPGSAWLMSSLSFAHLPHELRARSYHLLIAPIGALVVVFVRLTLGIRVLGPFRSVLLAIAFQVTGALVGICFYTLVIAAVVAVRPVMKRMRLPYFGHSAAMLSSVAMVIVMAMLLGLALGVREIERVAYFPVVVLTLTGEAFSKTARREGRRSAVWRAATTAATALVITSLAAIKGLREVLLAYPELLLVAIAATVVVCEFLPLRLFQHLNPPPVKRKKAKRVVAGTAPANAAPPLAGRSAPMPLAAADEISRIVPAGDPV